MQDTAGAGSGNNRSSQYVPLSNLNCSDKKKTKKYYQESNLYINASHFEGFPNAIVEAINFKLPVICSDTNSGVREITLNGNGGDLFKIGDYKNLANKIFLFYKT